MACLTIVSGGGIAMSVLVILNPDFSRFETFYPATGTWLGSSALADVIISTALVMTLVCFLVYVGLCMLMINDSAASGPECK